MNEEFLSVVCSKCGKKYRIKMPEKQKKYHCKECEEIIIVEPPGNKEEIEKSDKIFWFVIYSVIVSTVCLVWMILIYLPKNDKVVTEIKNEYYREFGYKQIISGDSALVKMVFIPEDSLSACNLFIRFEKNGCAREAYNNKDFKPSLEFIEVHNVEIKNANLIRPKRMWGDSLVTGLSYDIKIPMSFKTYQRIKDFLIPISSPIVRQYLEKSKSMK